MAAVKASASADSLSSGGSAKSLVAPLSDRHVAELTEAFNRFDLDKDGKITQAELGAVLEQLGFNFSERDIETMVREADTDGDGHIDLEEFLYINAAAEQSDGGDQSALLREVFEVFDKDKNGVICAEELHRVMAFMGDSVTVEECREMIRRVDSNGDGVVDFVEFEKMMTRTDLLPCPS